MALPSDVTALLRALEDRWAKFRQLSVHGQIDGDSIFLRRNPKAWTLQSARSSIGSVHPTTTSAGAVEIDSSLRVTVVVPPTGQVLVIQSAVIDLSTAGVPQDAFLYVSSVNGFARTGAGSMNVQSALTTVTGATVLTGENPGTQTYQMGWSVSNGATLECLASTRGAAQNGTWMMVLTNP